MIRHYGGDGVLWGWYGGVMYDECRCMVRVMYDDASKVYAIVSTENTSLLN